VSVHKLHKAREDAILWKKDGCACSETDYSLLYGDNKWYVHTENEESLGIIVRMLGAAAKKRATMLSQLSRGRLRDTRQGSAGTAKMEESRSMKTGKKSD